MIHARNRAFIHVYRIAYVFRTTKIFFDVVRNLLLGAIHILPNTVRGGEEGR